MKRTIPGFLLLFLMTSAALTAAPPSFTVETIAGDLNHPWSLAFLPGHSGRPGGERILVTERPGRLLLIENGERRTVEGVPEASVVGQGGLLDIVLSPTFESDRLVYWSFSEGGLGRYGTAVARGRLIAESPGGPRLEGVEVIYRARPRSGGGRHFGSRLAFDPDGYLFVTLGERGDMERAQDPHDPYGSVLRLRADGSVPDDNPFAPGGERPGGGAPEVWSFGHRNAQGLAVHPETGVVWLHEHGPKGGDEINIVRKGANYGWPRVTYGIDYDGTPISDRQSAPGFEEPLLYWTPSIAPSGMAFYRGDAFPEWRGSVFAGALAGAHLRRVALRGTHVIEQESLLSGRLGRIRDVRVDDAGIVWLLTDEDRGGLYRIAPGG